jgi:hypothetical protein
MTTVQVKRPEDTKLADWFAELRLWFDNNDCNPILFTEVAGRFNIKFADDVHAQLFATTFAKFRYNLCEVRPINSAPDRGTD